MNKRKTIIIAEAGVNHNGSLDTAKKLIDCAAEAGADAVKFQTFKAEMLVSRRAPKADYQLRTTGSDESQFDMLKKLELDENAHRELIDYCRERGIQFLSAAFDLKSAQFLVKKLDLPRIKIPSGEITNPLLLLELARSGKELILSTGMSTLGEIEAALGVIACGYLCSERPPGREAFQEAYCSVEGQKLLAEKVVLLHCTTEYPAPIEEVNLRAMETLRKAFGLKVGLSDHTAGIAIPTAAAALGAVVIEKHFTLDKTMPGPDHKASLEPGELKAMVEAIRQVELALGDGIKKPAPSELKNRKIVRKSLVAARVIRKGEKFTEDNLTVKRPGNGISPLEYWEWLGKSSKKSFREDEVIG